MPHFYPAPESLVTSSFNRFSLRTAIVSLSVHTVFATDGLWTNPAGGSWAEATNWSGSIIADGSGAIANFSTLDLEANATVSLDGPRTVSTLLFADAATESNDWTLAPGGGGTLTLATPSGTPAISVSNRTATVSTIVDGTLGFQKAGAGTLVLSGANTFTGQVLIGAGTVKAGNASALGAGGTGNETIVASGGTFDVSGQALTNTEIVHIAGPGVGGAGALVNTGGESQNAFNRVVLNGNASVGGSARFDVRPGVTPTLDLAGFTLTKTGTNQLSLVGTTITPGNIVINSGVLGIETTSTANATGSITINSPGILGVWGNTAGNVLRPVISNAGTIQNLNSDATLNSPISITTGSTLTLTGGSTTYLPAAISGTGDLIKNGPGAFTFAGNTFVGKTTVNQGYFGVTGDGAFGAVPAAFVADHITLANGAAGGLGNVVAGFYYGPTYGATRGITIAAVGGGFETYGHQGGRSRVIVNSVISGPGQLIKTGGGGLYLNAVNTYAGGTQAITGPSITENAGAIQIANYGGLSTGDLTFTNTASFTGLQFANSGSLPNNISLNTITGTNRFYVDPGRMAALAGVVSGGTFSGGFLQVDGGTLVLQAANTYSSATLVNSGTLLVNGSISESDATVNSGGAIGGSGTVRSLVLQDGAQIVASSPPLVSTLGIVANKTTLGVDVLVKDTPATPGTRTVDVIGYGEGDENGDGPVLANFSTASYRSASFADDTANNKITMTYANSARTWNVTNGIWDAGVTASWLEDDFKFFQGDAVTFGNPAAASTVTLTGALAPSAVTFNHTNNYIIAGTGAITSGSLVKSGTGALIITVPNTYAGGTVINGGTVALSAAAAFGGNPGALGTGSVTVNAGGVLKLWINNNATTNYTNPIILAGGRVYGEDGINVLDGPITLTAAGGSLGSKWNNKNTVVGNTISGPGKLTVARDATGGEAGTAVILTKAGTYEGGTDLFSGVLRLANSDQVLGTGMLTFTGNSTLATASNGGERVIGNNVTINNGVTGSIDAGFFPLTLAGVVTGPGVLTLASSGTLALSGANSYTGGTNINSVGTLRLESPTALGSTGTISFGGGTLQYSAASTTDYSARFSVAANQAYKVNTNGQTVSFASPLTSTGGSLTKSGPGTLNLVAATAYTGDTTVSAGTLSLGTATLPDTADLRMTTGAVVNLGFAGTDIIDEFYRDGVAMFKGTWGGPASTAAHKSALFTGTGILSVTVGPVDSGYDTWATANGLTALNNGKTLDPDFDGFTNAEEFAFNSLPLSGASSGKIVSKIATVGGEKVLTLTLPVRATASFTGTTEKVSGLVDGIVYRIQGSETLASFPLEVVEVTGADATAIQADLPGLTSTAWTYRSFRTAGTVSSAAKKFLRAVVE